MKRAADAAEGGAGERHTKPRLGDKSPGAVVLDIEGTTTRLAFVHEILFPYARREIAGWISKHGGDASVAALAELQREDVAGGKLDAEHATLGEYALWLIDNDRKVLPLKDIQGKLWATGYKAKELEGEVFADVVEWLDVYSGKVPTYIYSSGSVAAQKLIFGFSEHGDMLKHFRGHFDLNIGSKLEAESYRKIASEIDQPAEKILFLTDNVKEAVAAKEAGWRTMVMDRPGNNPLPDDHGFKVVDGMWAAWAAV